MELRGKGYRPTRGTGKNDRIAKHTENVQRVGSKNRGEWACSLKSCNIKYAWKTYVPVADTHGKDFLEAVDGTGDSETVWKHSKIFESWIRVIEKWNRLISESCLVSFERRSKICQAKWQIINGYNTRQDTENFTDTYGLCTGTCCNWLSGYPWKHHFLSAGVTWRDAQGQAPGLWFSLWFWQANGSGTPRWWKQK